MIRPEELELYGKQAEYLFHAAGMGDPPTEIVEEFAKQMRNFPWPDPRTSLIYTLGSKCKCND